MSALKKCVFVSIWSGKEARGKYFRAFIIDTKKMYNDSSKY